MKDNPPRVQEFGYRKPRFRADFHLLLQTEAPNSRVVDARCTDISEDGLAARVTEPLSLGSHVAFILTLPGSSTPVRIAATVNNQQQETYGFTFVFSTQEERNLIHAYLARLQRQASGSPRT
ncbi:MAG: PilZ domain-containing protein [Acidobacteriia bacterium]|nr:PilZ domain-containing protein [Terriglobia bacterium]